MKIHSPLFLGLILPPQSGETVVQWNGKNFIIKHYEFSS